MSDGGGSKGNRSVSRLLGLLGALFGTAGRPASGRAGQPAAPRAPSAVDEAFRPAAWVVREACERVMAGVETPAEVKKELGAAFVEAVRGGNPEAEEAAVVARLARVEWRWPEFEHWAGVFGERGEWPEGWRRFPALLAPYRVLPQSLEEALPYFSYLELRDLLGARRSARQSVPIRVEELERAVLEGVAWEEVAPLAGEKYRGFQERCAAARGEDLSRLLARHLRATCDNLVPYHQGLVIRGHELLRYRWEVEAPAGDPVAAAFAERFNQGMSETIPPFFPGDGSRLRLRRL
jgi:hypothetical protein